MKITPLIVVSLFPLTLTFAACDAEPAVPAVSGAERPPGQPPDRVGGEPGALEPAEHGACAPLVLEGDAAPETPEDLEALATVTEITGDLSISACEALLTEISLPCLERVGGGLVGNCVSGYFSTTAVERVSLPRLTSVGDWIHIFMHTPLKTLSLPALERVEGIVYIASNRELRELDLRALETSLALDLGDSPLLEALDLGALRRVEQSFGLRSLGLSHLSLPALESSGSFAVAHSDALTEVFAPRLVGCEACRVSVGSNAAMTRLSLPSLEAVDALVIQDSPSLYALELPELGHMRAIEVTGAPQLARCLVEHLLAQVAAAYSGEVEIEGVHEICDCSPDAAGTMQSTCW